MIKGIAQHVVPYENGWAVYEDWKPDTLRFFSTQEEAVEHAQSKALLYEAPLLIHSTHNQQKCPVTRHMMAGTVPE